MGAGWATLFDSPADYCTVRVTVPVAIVPPDEVPVTVTV